MECWENRDSEIDWEDADKQGRERPSGENQLGASQGEVKILQRLEQGNRVNEYVTNG
jgi:hypothetical protein